MGRAEQHNANTTRVLRKHQRLPTNTAPLAQKELTKKTNSSQHLNFEICTYINSYISI